MLTISGEDLLRKIVPGWNGEKTELEQPDAAPEPEDSDAGELEETGRSEEKSGSSECPERTAYSEADTEVFKTKRCRRGKHIEVSEEDKQRVCSSFAS